MEKVAARKTYAALRQKSALTPAKFNYEAERLAHELADGEEVTPAMWVQAAREILGEEGVK